MTITEEIRQMIREEIIRMKPCLSPDHIACEQCNPGFNERLQERIRQHHSYGDNWPISPVISDPYR